MITKEALDRAVNELKKNNVSEPEKSAEFLLRQTLQKFHPGGGRWDKAKIIVNPDYELTENQEKKFKEFIGQRQKHEPVWYITGKIEFYGLDLEVNQSVLIPRPETEFLVEEVLSHLSLSSRARLRNATERINSANGVEGSLSQNNQFPITNFQSNSNIQIQKGLDSRLRGNDKKKREDGRKKSQDDKGGVHGSGFRILELGTGSGAISLVLANEGKRKKERFWASQNDIQLFASDISKEALQVAKKNAQRLGLDSRLCGNDKERSGNDNHLNIEFRQGDLLEPWKGDKFDIIVANLPYIPHEDMSSLALDIRHWEPRLALDGGREGTEVYEKLLSEVGDYLNENAMMFFEIGINQGEKIKKLVNKYLPNAKVKIKKDYGDIDRIAIIEQKNGIT